MGVWLIAAGLSEALLLPALFAWFYLHFFIFGLLLVAFSGFGSVYYQLFYCLVSQERLFHVCGSLLYLVFGSCCVHFLWLWVMGHEEFPLFCLQPRVYESILQILTVFCCW